jgi:hypothetical protein
LGYFKGLKKPKASFALPRIVWLFYFIMAKLKIANKFATVPNLLLNDNLITLKAKGLYAYIQSKPDNWEFSAERISRQLREGLPSVKSALQELEVNGYLNRRRYQNNKGFWEVEYILFDNPAIENPMAENLLSGNPTQENPMVGKPSNNINKEFSNKESIKEKIERKTHEFIILIEPFRFDLGNEFQDFIEYWTEPNHKNGKLRYEDQKYFDISKRIKTWMTNSTKFKNNGTNNSEKLGTSAARMEALRNW